MIAARSLRSSLRLSCSTSQLNLTKPYVCNACIKRIEATPRLRRNYASSSSSSSNSPPPPPPKSFAKLRNRRLISLVGPDATKFLQGVLTQNLTPSSPSSLGSWGLFAAFLNAQGRVVNDVFLYPFQKDGEDGWLVEVDANEAVRLEKHIKRYKLRAKLKVRLLDEVEMGIWSVWDESKSVSEQGWNEYSIDGSKRAGLPKAADGSDSTYKKGLLEIIDGRAPHMGRRVLLENEDRPELDAEESSEDTYTVRRYLKGVAEGQGEILREAALPQESNIDYMGGIDYRKGCYVGQELTIRTHHTGVIRKRILPLQIYGEDEPVPETLQYIQQGNAAQLQTEKSIGRMGKKGRSAGKWLKGVGNLGLGLCRLEIMTGPGSVAEEFVIEEELDDGSTGRGKVKAFVPPWHPSK